MAPRPPAAAAERPPAAPAAPRRTKRFGWLALLVTALVALLLGVSIGAAGNNDTSTAQPATDPASTVTVTAAPGTRPTATTTAAQQAKPAPTVTMTTTTEAAPAADASAEDDSAAITDGQYLVGSEIKPGTWKAAEVDGDLCYADTKNKDGDILEQEVAKAGESVIIQIRRNAYAFTSRGCGTWKKVG